MKAQLGDVIRKNRSRLAARVLLCLSAAAAGDAPALAREPASQVPVKLIEKAIVAYARSIGCNQSFDPRNIVAMPGGYGVDGLSPYLVVYSVDVGCSGGSSSWQSAFAVLRPNTMNGVFVDPELSRPAATVGLPQFIERVEVRRGRIVYVAKEFDFTKDALCCPSVEVTGELALRTTSVDIGKDSTTTHIWVDSRRP